jgi:hypothetical protein
MVESGAHSAAKGVLLEATALREGIVERVLLPLDEGCSNCPNANNVKLIFVVGMGFLEVLNTNVTR